MANNYLQFSEVIANLTESEEAWLKEQLQRICLFGDREYPADEDGYPVGNPDEVAHQDPDWVIPRFLRDYRHELGNTEQGFCAEFHDDHDSPDGWDRHLWIYAEEGGEPDHAAWLVQKFLKQFRPQECWSLTYATTCSKLRVGEFAGGAVFVTADEIRWQGADDFIEQQRARFRARKNQGTSVTLDEFARLMEKAKQESPLGGGTCVYVCLPETESIPASGAVLERSDDGAVFLILTDERA